MQVKDTIIPVITEYNVLLAEYHVYYQKLRNFHWTIIGQNFFDLHAKFEELYEDARVKIDEIAERILTLNYFPLTKYSDYLKVSLIKESGRLRNDRTVVDAIMKDHETLLLQMKKIIHLANEAGDEGTIDLLGGYIRSLEKSSWMLSAWSSKQQESSKATL